MDTKDAKRTYENLLKRLRKGTEQDEITKMYVLSEMNLECESEPTQLEEEQNSNEYDDVKIEEDDEDDTTEDDLHQALGPRSWKSDKLINMGFMNFMVVWSQVGSRGSWPAWP